MKIETQCLHEGYIAKKGQPRQVPIIQSTTFKYETSQEMADLFDLEASGYFYSRLENPTNDHVAAKITALEGGHAGMLTSSGQAANLFAIFNICQAGDHFISTSSIYGGTYNLFAVTMKRMGIECTFVDQTLPLEELSKYVRANTKAVFGETISNPTVDILDIEKFAEFAHKNNVPLIIDNTFATPINCRPFEWGADIVTHSTTKYMDGHASGIGGALIDSGNFDWLKYGDKFPGLTKAEDSYHGLVFAEAFGKSAYIIKAVTTLMRDFGSCQSPQTAFYLNLGLESLHLRMKAHCENALSIAKFLQGQEEVAWVKFPELEGDPNYNLAKKYCPNGTSGVLNFAIRGGRERTIAFMDKLKLATIATHVADAKTCLLHPASHTHRQLNEKQLKEAGISPDLIRYSVGIENVEDLINDLKQALESIREIKN